MIIKRIFSFFLVVTALISLTACLGNNVSEVHTENKMPVQILYRQKLYNGQMCYKNNVLYLNLNEKNSAFDDMRITVDEKICNIKYKAINKNINTSALPSNNMFILIFRFFEGNTKPLVLSETNGECYYKKQKVNDSTVIFKEFNKNNIKSYTVEIK